jgi:hypothetical protein
MSLLTASADALPESGWTDGTDGTDRADDDGAHPAPAEPEARCRKRLLLAVVAIAGVLAGAIASGVLVTAAFLSAAEDIGRGMSEGLGSMRATLAAQDPADPAGAGVERFPAVAPGELGEDPSLDAAAQACFAGDLAACDVLWSESAPMSAYEQYAATCGGRVKPDAVPACTELG